MENMENAPQTEARLGQALDIDFSDNHQKPFIWVPNDSKTHMVDIPIVIFKFSGQTAGTDHLLLSGVV